MELGEDVNGEAVLGGWFYKIFYRDVCIIKLCMNNILIDFKVLFACQHSEIELIITNNKLSPTEAVVESKSLTKDQSLNPFSSDEEGEEEMTRPIKVR